MSPSPYNLEESLGYVMARAARALGTRLNRNFADAGHDVTCEQWSVLTNLWSRNGQSQQDLAGTTCKGKASVTRLIDNMERHNLVVRIPSKDDRRQKLIYLTRKGRDLQERLAAVVRQTLNEAQKKISPREIGQCKKILCRIYENVKD
ncbi:MAG: MarR family transcriptional regulator [Candidatus Omnitrophota bacterium]|nr:MarR family transcriptional regulator [Candidatus Omnitrophota bacterium]MDZ4241943.1 MarR family transcriptional regulator [Candidatus Omnitrophota bacterium]